MPNQIHQYSLLTGAGFTKNFGGYLAQDMWAQIFNHSEISSDCELKEKLRTDFDYESFYYEVLESTRFSDQQKEIVKKVMFEAYKQLDEIVKDWIFNISMPLKQIYSSFFGKRII